MSTPVENARPDIDFKIVGQIVSAIGLLHVFPSVTAVGEFLVSLLRGVPGCQSVRLCFRKLARPIGDMPGEACQLCARDLDPRALADAYSCGLVEPGKVRAYPLETAAGFYGYLLLAVGRESSYAEYEPFIRNLGNALAILLENRCQQAALQAAKENLEQQVAHRTRELASVIESSRDLIAMMDTGYHYTVFNSAFHDEFKNIFGRDLKPGDSMTEALAHLPQDLADALSHWDRTFVGEDFTITQQFGDTALARHWYEFHFSPVRDDAGRVVAGVHIIRNITERKRGEELQNKTQRLLAETQKVGKVGGWEFDVETGKQTWTEEIYRIHELDFSYDPTVERGLSFYTPATRPIIERAVNGTIERGEPFDLELEIITAKGNRRSVKAIGRADLENHRVYGFFQDITKHKQAEEALRESEERLQLFIEHAPTALAMFDRDLRYLAVSRRWISDYNLADNLIGRAHYDIFPDLPDRWKAAHRRGLAGEVVREEEDRFERADGAVLYARYEVRPWHAADGSIGGIIIFTEDITPRKQVEEALRVSKEKHRILLDESSDPIFSLTAEGRYTYVNRAFAEGVGQPVGSIIGHRLWDVFPKEDADKRFAVLSQVYCTGDKKTIDVRVPRPDGDRYFVTSITPVKDVAGHVISAICLSHDITERKRAEAALLRNRAMLARTESIAHMGSWEWDVATDAVTWSDEMFRMMQRNPADGTPSFAEHPKLYDPEDMRRLKAAVEAAVSDGTPYELELRAIRKDGQARIYLARGFAETGSGRTASRLFGSLQDITERKQAEAVLRDSLAEKTTLLKEVHHRVKNNLQIISSLLNLQARQVKNTEVLDLLTVTRNRVGAIALLHESLYQAKNLARLNLPDYVESLCEQLLRTVGPVHARVRIEHRIEPKTVSLGLDQAMPCGLLLNELVTNALKYAFPGERSGCIRVTLERATPQTARLTVADDGVGLPATLDPRHTASLGLQLVFLLTEQLHGTVNFERGQGTAVHILFPNSPKTETPHE